MKKRQCKTPTVYTAVVVRHSVFFFLSANFQKTKSDLAFWYLGLRAFFKQSKIDSFGFSMNCCSLRTYCKTGLPQSDLAYLAYALFPLTSRSPRLGSPLFSTYRQKAPGNSLALFSPVTASHKWLLTPRITPARPGCSLWTISVLPI